MLLSKESVNDEWLETLKVLFCIRNKKTKQKTKQKTKVLKLGGLSNMVIG